MIHHQLHLKPLVLDRTEHRGMKIHAPITDWSPAAKMNSLFVAAVEFADASRDMPIVFVTAGNDEAGKPQVAPVGVFGLAHEENLYLAEDKTWRGNYMPAVLRLYPFCIARVDAERYAICIDSEWKGVSQDSGEALFDANGEPSVLMATVQKQLEQLEHEIQRTRLVCSKLQELDLLRDMRFEAQIPGGQTFTVDGFFTVDEARLNALPDATLVDLQRTGVLGLIHAHLISLGNMRRLAGWRAQRVAAVPAATAPAA